jgi:hypothetical protein
MKGAFMNKATFNEPFVYAPQTYKGLGAYGILTAVALTVMLLAIYIPETKVIGQGLDYNLVP